MKRTTKDQRTKTQQSRIDELNLIVKELVCVLEIARDAAVYLAVQTEMQANLLEYPCIWRQRVSLIDCSLAQAKKAG